MSSTSNKCTDTGPANVGWCVSRSLLRKAATPLGFLKARIFQSFFINPLVSSGSTWTPRTVSFHFSDFSLWATNSPIYVSGLSQRPDLISSCRWDISPCLSYTYFVFNRSPNWTRFPASYSEFFFFPKSIIHLASGPGVILDSSLFTSHCC